MTVALSCVCMERLSGSCVRTNSACVFLLLSLEIKENNKYIKTEDISVPSRQNFAGFRKYINPHTKPALLCHQKAVPLTKASQRHTAVILEQHLVDMISSLTAAVTASCTLEV